MSQPPRNVKNQRREAAPTPAESPQPPPAQQTRAKSERPVPAKKEVERPAGPRFPRLARAASLAKLVLGLVFVVLASGAVAWGAKRYLVTSPRFAIKTVAVSGNARLEPQQVADLGGIRVGDNVFSLDLDQAKLAIEKDPWVASASVQRKLPGSVVVAVTEHEPAALVSIEQQLYLVARSGRVFKEVGPDDPLDLPVVTGIAAKDVRSDREGVEKEVQRALDVIDEVNKTTIAQRWPVQEVHLERDGSLEVIVGRDAIALHLGSPPFRGKLEQAERVFAELQKRKAQASIVFLDNDGSPERVVVRMK